MMRQDLLGNRVVEPPRQPYRSMPFFHVLVEGTNLCIPGPAGEPPIAGFFTSRIVWAADTKGAETKAMKAVQDVWASGSCAAQPTSDQLVLAVSGSNPSSFREWLRAPNKGHVFFPQEPRDEVLPMAPADGFAAR